MYIREYEPYDCPAMAALFYDTAHRVNCRAYAPVQLDVWATGQVDLESWNRSFLAHHTLVAIQDEILVGFGDMDSTGYLDRLYVHADYQGQGIATALCNALEENVPGPITTHASITARPLFESRGYRVVKAQQVQRQGIFLTNYVMEGKYQRI